MKRKTYTFGLSFFLSIAANPFFLSADDFEKTSSNASNLSSILRTKRNSPEPAENTQSTHKQISYLYAFPPPNADSQSPTPVTAPSSAAQVPSVHQLANELLTANDPPPSAPNAENKTILINFNNVSIIEYIRFISRITNRNFIFDENDLQFNVTIISEEPATIDNIMTALLQELRIHDLSMFEEDNSLIIHKNPKVNAISQVVAEDVEGLNVATYDIVTRVIRLNILDADKASLILRPLISDLALVEVLKDTNTLIITDITANIEKAVQLLKSIDAPNSGLVIGQYVSRITPIDTLIPLAQKIMQPISLDQPLTFVSHIATNSIFIVSTPFLVERTISILQYLDENQGQTRILNLKDLRLGAPVPAGLGKPPVNTLKTPGGRWELDENGNWIFRPELPAGMEGGAVPLEGSWLRDYEGKWDFKYGPPGAPGPKGRWVKDKNGNWVYELNPEETFNPAQLVRQVQGPPTLPGGVQKQARYSIFKLKYRKGDSVEKIIRQLADTIQQNERGNEDLIAALRSVQFLDAVNALVFSGTESSLRKIYAIVKEIDQPMRQVFVEMLLIDTSIIDSLNYGVAFGTDFGGGNTTGSQGFFSGSSPLVGALTTTGLSNLGLPIGNQQVLVPNGVDLAQNSGFNLGVIGQKITHCGTEFGSIGALVSALHDRTKDKVVMNPKMLIEDGTVATIFVGINTPFRTQSISNDRGSVITSNFDYRDIGTTLKITPFIGNGDLITMDIEEEDSTIIAGLITNANTANTSPGPTTRINRTKTRAHIPNKFFLVISGMLQHEESRERNQVPCLGGIPILGAGASSKTNTDNKRNLLMFLRPIIIDTEEEIQNITKRQQDIYDYKNCLKNFDEYEFEEALDLFNLTKTLHPEDEIECECTP